MIQGIIGRHHAIAPAGYRDVFIRMTAISIVREIDPRLTQAFESTTPRHRNQRQSREASPFGKIVQIV
jgi:hypothetical protein